MSIVIFFIIIILVIFLWIDTKKPQDFPPGPNWLPFIGSLPLIQKLHRICGFYYLVWHYLTKKYGPIVGLRIGRDRLIILAGKDLIKEFYVRPEFNGRPDGFFYKIRTFHQRLGVVFTDGPFWDIQRKFSLKILRQLSMGKYGTTLHIERESKEMIKHFMNYALNKKPINMAQAFDVPVLNVLWALVAGHRFELHDQRLTKLLESIHASFRIIDMSGGVLNQFPFIRFLAPKRSGYRPLIDTATPIWAFLKEIIVEIKNSIKYDEPRCLIEAFLREIEKNIMDKSTTFTEEQLLALCMDLFQAGTETTSNTLAFGIIQMLHNVNVQEKLRNELDDIVGGKRLPNLNDRSQLPYTEAVLCEIQRISIVAPLGIAHRCTETIKFSNYVIPKNTMVLVSYYSLQMNEEYWNDPYKFRPERFLNEYGQFVHHEHFIPFGLGKRRCMGENLAKSSLFVFFASFMHSFNIEVPPECKLPDLEPLDGITLSPKPFQVLLSPRILKK